jgi:HD superfamily phosphodiesterase
MMSADAARDLLVSLGAPPSLLTHVLLVGEAAELLLAELRRLGIAHDGGFVRTAVVFHDAGKILHPGELHRGGGAHEPAGEKLLRQHGVDQALARYCLSHARWAQMPCSLEELLVALADALWRGQRDAALEKHVVEAAGARCGRGFWDLFVSLDNCFESIAADGVARLQRSTVNSPTPGWSEV